MIAFPLARLRLKAVLRLLLLVVVVLLPGAARQAVSAQTPPPIPLDSLRARLGRPHLPDTTRVLYLAMLGAQLQATDLPAARRAGEQSLALARRIGDRRGEVHALNNLAAAYYNASDYPAAQRTFEALLRVSQRNGMAEQTGNAWLGLGNVAQALSNIPRALRDFEQARRVYATMSPPSPNGQILVLNNSANAYILLHQPARADRARRQALALVGPTTRPHLHLVLLDGLAGHQLAAGYPDSAQATVARGLKLALQGHNLEGEAILRNQLAEIELARARPARARIAAERALALARQVGDPFVEEDALNGLAISLHALHRPEAYDTLRTYMTLHDTIVAQDRADAIIEAQTRFDVAGQQARIRTLEQQRRIADLEAERRVLQTSWIVGWLAALAVLVAAGLTWVYRRRQARRENQLRTRLAADLHDDVGSLLSQMALQSDLLHEGLTPVEQQPALWAEMADSSRMAIRQLNDVVWDLDAHNDTVPDLLNRLRDYAHELLPPSGRDVRFRADAALPAGGLSAPVRRNLYLIYKEALHNILKYAPPGCCVTVALGAANNQLVLSVVNDAPPGAGAASPGRTSGHGLRNIRDRAHAVGGSATAAPLPDGGFAVQVRVPL